MLLFEFYKVAEEVNEIMIINVDPTTVDDPDDEVAPNCVQSDT